MLVTRQEAAKLLSKLAADAAREKVRPVRTKKLYVLAAMEVERFKAKVLDPQALLGGGGSGTTKGGTRAAATLDGLMTLDSAQSEGTANMENAWHGAEVRAAPLFEFLAVLFKHKPHVPRLRARGQPKVDEPYII